MNTRWSFASYHRWFKGKSVFRNKTFKMPFLTFSLQSKQSIFCHSLSKRGERKRDRQTERKWGRCFWVIVRRCCVLNLCDAASLPLNTNVPFCFLHTVQPLLATPQTKLPTAVIALSLSPSHTSASCSRNNNICLYICQRSSCQDSCRFIVIFRQAGPRLLQYTNAAFCFLIRPQETSCKDAVTLVCGWNPVI